MKIQLLSDLHLEAQPDWTARAAAQADVLVLAGDIGSYQNDSRLQDARVTEFCLERAYFGLQQFSPHRGWPTAVVYVPGNHEYDGLDFDATHARLQDVCAELGIQWLERQVFVSAWHDRQGKPVRFVGTTLWSDFEALHQPRDKAFRAANFYLRKAATSRHGAPFLAEEVRAQALECQAWLRHQLQTPFDGSTVVVTHFAPSLRSADPRYGLTPGTAGFCNALDDMLAHAQLWLHGHLHAPSHYVANGCTVQANPLGYARKNEQLHFAPTLCIDI